jgi:hypothetical protein
LRKRPVTIFFDDIGLPLPAACDQEPLFFFSSHITRHVIDTASAGLMQ